MLLSDAGQDSHPHAGDAVRQSPAQCTSQICRTGYVPPDTISKPKDSQSRDDNEAIDPQLRAITTAGKVSNDVSSDWTPGVRGNTESHGGIGSKRIAGRSAKHHVSFSSSTLCASKSGAADCSVSSSSSSTSGMDGCNGTGASSSAPVAGGGEDRGVGACLRHGRVYTLPLSWRCPLVLRGADGQEVEVHDQSRLLNLPCNLRCKHGVATTASCLQPVATYGAPVHTYRWI